MRKPTLEASQLDWRRRLSIVLTLCAVPFAASFINDFHVVRGTVQTAPVAGFAGKDEGPRNGCVLIRNGLREETANSWTEVCQIEHGKAKAFSFKVPWMTASKGADTVIVRFLQEHNATHAAVLQTTVAVLGLLEGLRVDMADGAVVVHSELEAMEKRWLDPHDAFAILLDLISPDGLFSSDAPPRRHLLDATRESDWCVHPDTLINSYFIDETCFDVSNILVEAAPRPRRRKQARFKRPGSAEKTSKTSHPAARVVLDHCQTLGLGVAALGCLLTACRVRKRSHRRFPSKKSIGCAPDKAPKCVKILHLVNRPIVPNSNRLWARDAKGRLQRTVRCSTGRDSDDTSYPQILHRTTACRFSTQSG